MKHSIKTVLIAGALAVAHMAMAFGQDGIQLVPQQVYSFPNDAIRTPSNNSLLQTLAGAVSGGKVAVSGSVPTLPYTTSTSVSVTTSSGVLFAAGAYTRSVLICTLPASTTNVWLRLDGGTAAVSSGVPVFAGGGCTTIGSASLPMPTSAVTAITDGGSSQVVTLAGG